MQVMKGKKRKRVHMDLEIVVNFICSSFPPSSMATVYIGNPRGKGGRISHNHTPGSGTTQTIKGTEKKREDKP